MMTDPLSDPPEKQKTDMTMYMSALNNLAKSLFQQIPDIL